MTVSIAAWMLPREDRVPSVRSRSRSSRRVLRFIRSVRSSSSSTKPVMPPSGPRTGATRTCNSCSPRTVVATCEEVAESCSMRSRACASRSRSMMPKTERPRPTARVIAQHRPRGGVVEQDLPVDVAHDDRRGEFGHQRGQPVPLLREARLRGANLRVDLPFGDPAPLGQVVHRGGQLREFGGSRPVQPVFGVGLEERAGSRRSAAAPSWCSDPPDAPPPRRVRRQPGLCRSAAWGSGLRLRRSRRPADQWGCRSTAEARSRQPPRQHRPRPPPRAASDPPAVERAPQPPPVRSRVTVSTSSEVENGLVT